MKIKTTEVSIITLAADDKLTLALSAEALNDIATAMFNHGAQKIYAAGRETSLQEINSCIKVLKSLLSNQGGRLIFESSHEYPCGKEQYDE